MYHKIKTITIFSMNFDIQNALTQMLETKKHINYNIETLSNYNENHQNSDIIICDLPVLCLLNYRNQMKENTYLFYISDYKNDLCNDYYEVADEVLIRPIQLEYLNKRVYQIYQNTKQGEELWLNNTYLNVLIDSMPDLVWFKDINGIHMKVNDVFCQTVGKKKKEIEGKDHCSVWDVKIDDCAKTEDIVKKEKKTCQFNELVKSRNGLRQFRTYKSPLFNPNGELIGTVGIGHDITDLENMSTEMEILFNSMPYAVLLRNQDGVILNINKKFEEYFHTVKNKIIGKTYDDWYHSLLIQQKYMKREDNGKIFLSYEDQERILDMSYEKVYDIFKNHIGELCIYRDTTEAFLLEQQLSNNSHTDFLTGLYNRRYFYEYYSEHHSFDQISILYVDLDHFKIVNDTYGHQIGDEVLKISAQILHKLFPNDTITRLGGDEFLVLKYGIISKQELIEQGNNLIIALQEQFKKSRYYYNLSASVGISYTTDNQKIVDELIKESDTALYEAKQTGRSKCCIFHK